MIGLICTLAPKHPHRAHRPRLPAEACSTLTQQSQKHLHVMRLSVNGWLTAAYAPSSAVHGTSSITPAATCVIPTNPEYSPLWKKLSKNRASCEKRVRPSFCLRPRGERGSADGTQRSQDDSDRHCGRGAGAAGVHGACLPVMRASTREEMRRISSTSRSSSRLFSIHSL